MDITNLKVNHMHHPVGFSMDYVLIQWEITNTTDITMKSVEVTISKDKDFTDIVDKKVLHDTNQTQLQFHIHLESLTKYYFMVKAIDHEDIEKKQMSYFITPKSKNWQADFITPHISEYAIILKDVFIEKDIKSAYLSICGLGLYEAYLNDAFINHEYLMPGYHSYDTHLQFQTYDLKEYFNQGKNILKVMLGNGWYKGRLGFDGGFYHLYGDKLALIFEIYIQYSDGTEEIIKSDKECYCMKSPIISNGIYDGEKIDMTIKDDHKEAIDILEMDKSLLVPRYSLPICIKKRIKPINYFISPKGEHILDFGQNLTGWIEFKAKNNTFIQFGEILQDDCFYNENYRTAIFGFCYIGDGIERYIRPHFTFYGFRYAKIETDDVIDMNHFEACLITSNMDDTGYIETGHQKVNQLLNNIRWSQMDNFLDVPTDCPQRDERLGWSGDAQIFSGTALFNMNAIQFYQKYLHDMLCEQKLDNGAVPNVIPAPKPKIENYAWQDKLELGQQVIDMFKNKNICPWADAATIIPWNVYQFSGDKELLKETYPNMKMWVDNAIKMDKESGQNYLLDSGFHFADWLALDAKPGTPIGATDMYYVASIFYYYSTLLVSYVAKILQLSEEKYYQNHASLIRKAIRNKYIDNGIVNIDTQTGYVLAVYFNILEKDEIQQNVDKLVHKIRKNNNKLQTGFVGTPFLNFVLSQNGYVDLAYDLLLNEEYPGWLYEVNLGATTIWERWNSVLENGKINSEGMNSLNHYAYGSIAEWIYREVCGINQLTPGFKKVMIKPKLDKRLGYCQCSFQSVNGMYYVQWNISQDSKIKMTVDIPFGCEAILHLPLLHEEKELVHGHYEFEIDREGV